MRFLVLAVIGVMCAAHPASAAITWNVTYADGTSNVGFGTGNAAGATRRATFEAALNYVSSVFDTPNVTLDFTVNASQTDGSGFLASAGTSFFDTNGYTNGVLFQHATTGVDPTGGNDGQAQFDFGFNWNNENDAPAAGEFDLFTVSLHEVTHAMGFLSLVDANGNSLFGGNPDTFSVMNSFMERGDGTDLFASGATAEFLGAPADLTSNDVFFNGPNANAANGGNPVKIYAPGTFAPGSSISHVDLSVFPNAVMTHAVAPGVSKKAYTDIDLGILQDIGWSLTAVPEPTSLSFMMIAGLMGCGVRRRRRGI